MAETLSILNLMQGVPARSNLFRELQKLIYTGRVGDSALVLEQQLQAFETIVADYGSQPSFQPYLIYFRKAYMPRIRTSTAISSALKFILLLLGS